MDKYDKMTDETLNKAYANFLDSLNKEANKKKSYDCDLIVSDKTCDLTVSDKTTMYKEYGQTGGTSRYYGDYIDSKIMINGYEIKPELMNKIKSFEDFNVFLESCKNNVIEDSNRQKTASVLSRTIATNYDEKEIKLLVEYLKDYLNNTKKSD